ncbi:MAG: hypothetical protein MJZ20_10865 [Bacteroidaceae bacterium]|nr:hypothetical protein [Bacteroidaceae bacterium]
MAKEKFVKAIKYDICGTLCQNDEGAYFVRVQFEEDIFEDYPIDEIFTDMLGEQIVIKCESAV